MPCNSDHLDPTTKEIEMSKVLACLDELKFGTLNRSHYNGMHPKVYGKFITKKFCDTRTKDLCGTLKAMNQQQIKGYSLELQMWWRDHQEDDLMKLKLSPEQLKKNVTAIRNHLCAISDEDRINIFDDIMKDYCEHCGADTEEKNGLCYCQQSD